MRKIRSLFLTLVICGSTLANGMSVSAQTTFPDGGKVDDDITRSSLLGISNQFHIFANTASLTAHTSGNIAVGNLINTTSNFGTSIHEGTLAKDISYIQKLGSIASSSFTTSNNKRTNKVVFGESVALTLVDNGNRVAANGITLDHLKKDEVFQDKHGKTYIDFAEEFKKLELSSNAMAGNPQTLGIEKNFIDENNRYFDISKAQSNPSGSVTLHKTDDAGKPLDGVTFDLYKEGQSDPIKKGLKTVHGKI
ncbi:collagen-binding domain-containing protein [Streptococcus ovis]|uniref:collagen-binding domain-containing protein n=1 Tax=Streptococcus ovis TaxID=82806 RepID=UPI0012EA7BF2|nr:collagen-binding domain-containing protein [Streptococcus ovis]